MLMKKLTLISLFTILILPIFSFAQSQNDGMSNKKIEKIIKNEASEVEGQLGSWQFLYGGRLVFIITDEGNNRMRIFAPVIASTELDDGQLEKMLEANFHSALDAKYSLYENFVISVFTHPLKELTDEQFIDAMRQVVVLADTFGTTYSSTDLIFGGEKEKDQKDIDKEKRLNKKPSKSNG